MEVRYFKLVIAIAETGSITRAADKLFLTQSALSHQLKEIESQLGSPLFARVNKKLILTSSGKLFLNASYLILDEIQKLRTEIKRLAEGETGRIRLTTESSTCYHWLPGVLKEYQEEFPNVEVQLSINPSNRPLDLLLSGKVDVAVMHRNRPAKNIEFISLFTDDVVALVSTSDSLASKSFLTPEDFKNVNYITHSRRFDESAFFEGFLKPHHIMPRKVTYIQLTEAVVAMVKEGLGVAVMANWLVTPYLDPLTIRAVKITRSGLRRKWFIGLLANTSRPKYFDRFVRQMESVLVKSNRSLCSRLKIS